KRCCAECCVRQIEVAGAVIREFYHRYVVLQLVGVAPALILDAEALRAGETETHAALRLLRRVKERLPRFIDVLTLDAFYLQAPFVKQALELGYGLAIVLKQEARDLYQDVEGLLKTAQPERLATLSGSALLWDFKDLRSWEQLGRPVRVVRSLEEKRLRERIGGQWIERTVTQDWRWAVVFPDAQQPAAEKIRQWGHARWDEETRGFGELTKHWHLDHCYRHHPTAMLACLLILFLAFVLTTVFFTRNLKAPLRQGKTRLHLARLLYDDLVRGGPQSFWAQPP
ncbi:MAG: transposase, partial [Terriglobales bacterium]